VTREPYPQGSLAPLRTSFKALVSLRTLLGQAHNRTIRPFPVGSTANPRIVVNLPNYITSTRIFAVPLLIWVLSTPRLESKNGLREITAVTLFILAAITDAVDGYLARRRGQITAMGMLLDPLADKLMIAAAFVTLVQFNPRIVPAWMAVIVIGREFLVSGLRSIAAQQGFTIEASDLGKSKMVVQIVAVAAAILDHQWRTIPLGAFIFPMEIIAHMAMWFMVSLSLISAIDYYVAFWRKIEGRVERRRRSFVLSRRRKREIAAKRDVPAT
jgi:CDP-diacylglycerol---glycerol-3-phosphate 3-phosphatidyltransferase